jgi:hypothetical protein
MDPETTNPFSDPDSDPFLDYLITVLSIYEQSPIPIPFPVPVPQYNGPSTLQTDNVLRAMETMARRMCTAEEVLARTKAGISEICRLSGQLPAPVKFRSNFSPLSTRSTDPDPGHSSATVRPTVTSGSSVPHSSSSSPLASLPSGVASLTLDSEQNIDISKDGSGQDPSSLVGHYPDRATSSMTISLDDLQRTFDPCNASLRADPNSTSLTTSCPVCGNALSDGNTVSNIPTFEASSSNGSPLVAPPGEPPAAAAFESGMGAIEELRLLKAQVGDIARVCNAVARGDLSQKITVPVQGVVMMQLKDVVNGMVDKLGQVAREVTRVSQEVGTAGWVCSRPTPPCHHT